MLGWLTRGRRNGIESLLHEPLLAIGRREAISLRDAFENVIVLGAVGSGKTSGSGYAICRRMLELGLAGCVLTAKPDEAERWRRLCEITGRSHDLVIFNDKSGHEFSFLDYELGLYGGGGNAIENVVATLEATIKVSERATGSVSGQGQEAFWNQGRRRHARAVIALLVYATGSVSIEDILDVMRDVPRSVEQANHKSWQQQSVIMTGLEMARAKCTSEIARHDINQIEAYFLREFPQTAERTRSVFEAGLYGILDLLARGSLYWTFGRGTNLTPDDCDDGKIIVVDWPVATHGAVGLIAQTLFKLAFQRKALQRSGPAIQPLFLVADEYQTLVTESDYQHLAISRASRIVNVLMTQSIASLHAVLDSSESGKAAVDALLGLANYKIMHANSCPVTNQWCSELIGRRRMLMRSSSVNHPAQPRFQFFPEEPAFTTSVNETFEYVVMPNEFTSLQRGGPPHMVTEAIIFGGGRVWKSSGDTYVRTSFKQGF